MNGKKAKRIRKLAESIANAGYSDSQQEAQQEAHTTCKEHIITTNRYGQARNFPGTARFLYRIFKRTDEKFVAATAREIRKEARLSNLSNGGDNGVSSED